MFCTLLKYYIRTKYCSCLYIGNFPSHLLSVPKTFLFHSLFLALFTPPTFPCSLKLFVFNSFLSSLEKGRLAQHFFLSFGRQELGAPFANIF